FGADDLSREQQPFRQSRAETTCRALGATQAWDDADSCLGKSEARVRGRDDVVARESDLHAAAEGQAVNAGDHRFPALLDFEEQRLEVFRQLARAPQLAALDVADEESDVGPGDERSSRGSE